MTPNGKLTSLFKSPKKLFYLSVCIISVISLFILLLTIKSSNRKFNPNLISSAKSLFISHLENLNLNLKQSKEDVIPKGINIYL
jgi:hypothetical protein